METKEIKYPNEDPERIRASVKELSEIPVRYFKKEMSPKFVQDILLDYAEIVEKLQNGGKQNECLI